MSLVVQFLFLAVLVFLSALCSSSETAITSLGKTRIEALASQYEDKSISLTVLAENPNRLITSILIMNNLVNVGASSLSTLIFIQLLPQGIPQFQQGILSTLVMTTTLLIFGEITPKNFAKNNAERYSLAIINLVYYSSVLLKPFVSAFKALSEAILRLFGEEVTEREPTKVSEDQIKALIDLGEDRELFAHQEGEMMKRIFSYDDLTASEVMVPRTDVKAIETSATLKEARKFVTEDGHSRYPVLKERIDDITGTLYSKDLLKEYDNQDSKVSEITRPAYYTPTTKPINALLREFQRKRVHLAVVVDKHGGMSGIITLEDILEEIVGEIEDEFDTHKEEIEQASAGEAYASGKAEIKHLNRMFGLSLPKDDITIGGLLMRHLEDIPEEGEELSLNGVNLTVEKASDTQIKRVRIQYDPEEIEE